MWSGWVFVQGQWYVRLSRVLCERKMHQLWNIPARLRLNVPPPTTDFDRSCIVPLSRVCLSSASESVYQQLLQSPFDDRVYIHRPSHWLLFSLEKKKTTSSDLRQMKKELAKRNEWMNETFYFSLHHPGFASGFTPGSEARQRRSQRKSRPRGLLPLRSQGDRWKSILWRGGSERRQEMRSQTKIFSIHIFNAIKCLV